MARFSRAERLWHENSSGILRQSFVEHHFNDDAEMLQDALTRDLVFHLHLLCETACDHLGVGFYFLAKLIAFFEIHENPLDVERTLSGLPVSDDAGSIAPVSRETMASISDNWIGNGYENRGASSGWVDVARQTGARYPRG
jgi:hypothetical protein